MYNKRNKELYNNSKEILRKLYLDNLSELDLKSILYVACLEKSNRALDDLEDSDLKFHTKLIYSKYENQIRELRDLLSIEVLTSLLLDTSKAAYSEGRGRVILKDGIYKLLVDLLKIEEGDKIGDFQLSSFSNFEYIIKNKTYKSMDIFESDMQKNLIYKMKNDILEGDARIIEFSLERENINKRYNKVISPIRFKVPTSQKQMDILTEAYPKLKNISKRSDGWADILNTLLYLEDNGKLVSLAVSSMMYSSLERNIREYFVENGLIETVISLPENILNGTGISSAILVISKNNTSINFIDAKDIYTSIGRFEKELTQEKRQEILDIIGKDTNNSTIVSIEEVKAKDYILDPKRYLNEISFKEEVLLGQVAMVSRGSNITNKEMERYKSDKKTKYRFLNLVDIKEGRIENTALSLKENLVESNEKLEQANRLKNGQVILSRTGNPIRIAIVEDTEDEIWFFSGNIYSISLDLDKYNPYYLKVFLESEVGQEILKQISLGSVIPNISMKDLKEIKLPAIDIEEQNKVADLYLNYEEKIRNKERELKTLRINRQKDLSDILSREEMGLCN